MCLKVKKITGSKMQILCYIAFFIVIVTIAGCAADNGATGVNEKPATEEEATQEEAVDQEEEITPEQEFISAGESRETEGGIFTLKGVNHDIEMMDVGPALVDIKHVKTVSGVLTGEMKDLFEQEELEYISIDLFVENISGEDITYYVGQAEIVTDTGEQLQPDIWMSEHIQGEMRAGVKQTGNLVYIMKHSKAQDVGLVRIIINAPMDENWNTIGDKIDIEVDI